MPSTAVQRSPGWAEVTIAACPSAASLLATLEGLAGEPDVHAVLVDGTAPPGFEAISLDECRQLERSPLPLVHVFDGRLEGAAVQVALACDIRICGPEASFRVPIGSRRALTLLGIERSATLLASRGRADAATALSAGLVSAVAESTADALEQARRLAGTIASRGPIAVRLAKEAIWRGLELPFEHALRFETDLTLLLQTTKDRAEGVRAFMEKRPPRFTGD